MNQEISQTFVSEHGTLWQNVFTNLDEEFMFFPDGVNSFVQNPINEFAIFFTGESYII